MKNLKISFILSVLLLSACGVKRPPSPAYTTPLPFEDGATNPTSSPSPAPSPNPHDGKNS